MIWLHYIFIKNFLLMFTLTLLHFSFDSFEMNEKKKLEVTVCYKRRWLVDDKRK